MTSSARLVPRGNISGKLRVPPSKSYTHRAVIMASLSDGTSVVRNPLLSRDTLATFQACKAMGARIGQPGSEMTIMGAEPRAAADVVNVENSGTTLRFMASVFSLPENGYTILTGDDSIRHRPMQGLIDALRGLGAHVRSSNGNGCAPVIVGEGGLAGGSTEIMGDVSSQFVSSVLISAPMGKGDSIVRVTGAVSRPYIDATLLLSKLHAVEIERDGHSNFRISGRQRYRPVDFAVPGDFGSAAFVMAAVAILGGKVEFSGLETTMPQGDLAAVDVFRRLGVRVDSRADSVVVQSDGDGLGGGSFDLADSPDLLPVLSVLSLKCNNPLEIHGVAHARLKESDRVEVAAEGLRMMGAKVEEQRDGIRVVKPQRLSPALLDAHNDHRMFMAFSLASMLSPGSVRVVGVESLGVSYPSFLEDLTSLGVGVEVA